MTGSLYCPSIHPLMDNPNQQEVTRQASACGMQWSWSDKTINSSDLEPACDVGAEVECLPTITLHCSHHSSSQVLNVFLCGFIITFLQVCQYPMRFHMLEVVVCFRCVTWNHVLHKKCHKSHVSKVSTILIWINAALHRWKNKCYPWINAMVLIWWLLSLV